MRFAGTCFRAHDPRWAFKPLSGEGAAIHGGRFNRKGRSALYLALNIVCAVREANQGLAAKIDPLVICSYEVDCEPIADLRNPAAAATAGQDWSDLSCAWFAIAAIGQTPPSWRIADRLIADGLVGALVPSFAVGATKEDCNLVLWTWGAAPPARVTVHDPSGRLPKNRLSWD